MHISHSTYKSRRVRSVVPSTHSTSPIYSSCHQPGSPPPLCSASCHTDGHAQASEVIRSHRPLGLLWGLRTIHVLSTLASTTRRRSGDDLAVIVIKHGYVPSRMTSKQQNMGLWSARHRAYDREQWRDIMETATLL